MSGADDRDGNWTLLTGHGHVLVEIARNPEARVRDISAAAGLTERTAQAIVSAQSTLVDAGPAVFVPGLGRVVAGALPAAVSKGPATARPLARPPSLSASRRLAIPRCPAISASIR